ncbi:FAD-dependent monooxygenase [Nocardia concava]|uniref:FAD-dependent monooxygenase n=1 Tax=Nocardia concava TaxID=257281 RepID=UPI0005946C4F|nr:FAD-dependent monooxygenase [Nocardia concava]
MRNKTVLICGASIAGPALAYWLNRYGFQVTVVEKAPTLRPGGQAVDFTGETHHRVLEQMGILEDVYAHQTGKTDTVFVDADGKQVAFMSGDFTGGDVEILRGDLSRIMYETTWQDCEYIFGDSIGAITETDSDVWVEFERAAPRRFDLVFGADGIHSRVRRLVFGPEKDFVQHQGHYYCVVGASPWTDTPAGNRDRITSYGHNDPGRYAVSGGAKAQQMYLFASPEIDYPRDDVAVQRQIVKETFAGMGWRVPDMLAEIDNFDDLYLDAIAKVRKMKSFTRGRVALVGDAGYANTLAGFGTGAAVVGAYVLAGELARAAGDHTAAFPRYDEVMRQYSKLSDSANAGSFLCPKTARGLRFRNWFLGSKGIGWMEKMAEGSKNLELRDYPTLVASAREG